MSVRQFLLKKFPKSKYYDCPIPKEYWGIMQEYADSECYDALEEYKAIELQNKVINDPATPESTDNWQKVGDKDKFMDEVRWKETTEELKNKIVERFSQYLIFDQISYVENLKAQLNLFENAIRKEYEVRGKERDVSTEDILEKHISEYNSTVNYVGKFNLNKREVEMFSNTMKEYASIVNRKDNVPHGFKEVTGHDSPKEKYAYEKGREDEQKIIMDWIEKWDGSINSVMGELLQRKLNERKDNVGVNEAIEFADWLRTEKYFFDNKKVKYIAAWDNYYEEYTLKELYLIFKSESKQKNINQ